MLPLQPVDSRLLTMGSGSKRLQHLPNNDAAVNDSRGRQSDAVEKDDKQNSAALNLRDNSTNTIGKISSLVTKAHL